MESEPLSALLVPLEDREGIPGFWPRLGKTLALGFTHPLEFFARIPNGQGLGGPIRFTLLISVPLYLFLCLYPMFIGIIALIERAAPNPGPEPPLKWISLGCLGGILLMPPFQILFMELSALIQYGFLRLWGVHDPQLGLEQDARAWIYAQAFLVMGALTPLAPVAWIAVLVVVGLGYAHMHGVPAWRGVAATLSHVATVLICALALMLTGIWQATAHLQTPQPIRAAVDPAMLVRPGMSQEASLTLHLDQARVMLNGLSREEANPEAAIEKALEQLPASYPPCFNPYTPRSPAFRSGPPQALGEVGLLPLHEYNEPGKNLHFHSGVELWAWAPGRNITQVVSLDR